MSLTTILDLHVKPDDAAGAPAVLRSILTDTRNFDGCLGVDVMVDVADPAHYVLFEKWESVEADSAYRAWRATPEGASSLGNILAGPPAVTMLNLVADI